MIGVGAVVENIFPPIPADTFVLFGAFIAETGRADPLVVFLITWVTNVAGAITVYALARRYGAAFFRTTVGHWLLRPHQLTGIARFYDRFGVPAIFLSRFLPAFRAMAPVFAGIIRLSPIRLVPPLALASGIWYGVLVILGATASRRWEQIVAIFSQVSGILLWIAIPLLILVLVWWFRTRRLHRTE